MMTPYLNMKPGQRDDTTGRVNFVLPTTTQGEGAPNHECYKTR